MDNIVKYQYVANSSNKTVFAKDTQGNMWTWGYQTNYILGPGISSSTTVANNISNTIGKIKDFAYTKEASNGYPIVWVLTENNKLCYWGGNRSTLIDYYLHTGTTEPCSFENASFVEVKPVQYYTGSTITNIRLITDNGVRYKVGDKYVNSHNIRVKTEFEALEDMYVATIDGSIYYKNGNVYYSINKEKELPAFLKKQFILIKDAKYNDVNN